VQVYADEDIRDVRRSEIDAHNAIKCRGINDLLILVSLNLYRKKGVLFSDDCDKVNK
jgi:hypothetical protein